MDEEERQQELRDIALSFKDDQEFAKYAKAFLEETKPKEQENITPEMKKRGYPMSIIGMFLKTTDVEDNWTKLTRFIRVDGKIVKPVEKIKWRFYENGITIEKRRTGYVITTFTPDNEGYIINHQSIHTNNCYGLISGYVNMFQFKEHFSYYGDGADYIEDLFDNMIERAKKLKEGEEGYWDEIN